MPTTLQTRTGPADVSSIVSPGGLEAWQVRSSFVPLVALAFAFEGGAAQDPPGREGAMQLLARLLDEGAGPYRSDAFQERLADHAIELSFTCGPDALGGSLKTLVAHADEAFALLRLAVTEPRFDDDAIERVRAQTLAGLRYQANDPSNVASRRFVAEAFPDHPYGHPSSGTQESVAAITREDLLGLHRRIVSTGRLKIAAVGDISEAALALKLDATFGDLPKAPVLNPIAPAFLAGRGARHVVDVGVPQSVIRFGFEGASWRDPDFIPTYVLNHILGGGAFTSRLFQEVRERRGLAYSVGTSLVSYRRAAMTWGYTATKNERVAECLDVIGEEIRKLREEGPSDEELEKAKAYLTGSYALSFDTSTKIAHQLAQISFEELGIDYLRRRNDLVAAVTQDDIRRVSERSLGDGSMLVVIAGRPDFFKLRGVTTIFLAGASGAIGSGLAPLLVRAGHGVIGTTRRPEKAPELGELGIVPSIIDVYDAKALREAVVAAKPEIVLHQLTDLPAGMRTDDMAAALARNARLREVGTANLVAAAVAAGARRMVAQSLAFVYAPGPLPHTEGDPIDPSSTGVLSLERQVSEGPFESVILRYGRLWGPGTGFDSAQPGGCAVHIDAAAHAAALALEKGSGAYNIAEATGEVANARARTELGWTPDFRL